MNRLRNGIWGSCIWKLVQQVSSLRVLIFQTIGLVFKIFEKIQKYLTRWNNIGLEKVILGKQDCYFVFIKNHYIFSDQMHPKTRQFGEFSKFTFSWLQFFLTTYYIFQATQNSDLWSMICVHCGTLTLRFNINGSEC